MTPISHKEDELGELFNQLINAKVIAVNIVGDDPGFVLASHQEVADAANELLERLRAEFKATIALRELEAGDKQLAWIEDWVSRTPKSEWTSRIYEAIKERRAELTANTSIDGSYKHLPNAEEVSQEYMKESMEEKQDVG